MGMLRVPPLLSRGAKDGVYFDTSVGTLLEFPVPSVTVDEVVELVVNPE